MARSDILISLIQSANRGDMVSFRKAVEILIAEERSKKHDILADRLANSLKNGSNNGVSIQSKGEARDLLFESIADRTFDGLLLDNEIKSICNELIEEQHRADLLRSHGLEPRNRILLAGSPGNGKTSLAEAIATHLMYPLYIIRYENLIGSYLGETASRLQKVFEYVKTRNCVLFFDEFDTIGKERGDTKETGEIKRVVSSLLLQMDRLPTYVVIITASNHPELLDRAVWRRFQIRLELKRPKNIQIESFIDNIAKKSKCNFNYSYKTLSNKLKGKSYSEIEEFCVEIIRKAVLQHKQDDAKAIVSKSLKQWQIKYSGKNVGV
ncbi:MAG: AAA family ATPase [Candidatus Krumholzibacteriota bacterium]|nr:AAA family ATPase [Candidatus Krumholzibacteriota bacterium]